MILKTEREKIIAELYQKKGQLWMINSNIRNLLEDKDNLWAEILELEKKLKQKKESED
jgi:endonuclease V-like protein UPF0215 family